MSIAKFEYRGRNAVSLASSKVEALFFLDFGAKLVSLRNLDNSYEFLQQGRETVHPFPEYASSYVENDLCGADDIFPSVNRCAYPDFPWEGISCPPHGELWSIPWHIKIEDDSLTFCVRGIRFPYTLERKVAFSRENCLRLDYAITNESPFPLAGMWVFHPLFTAGADSRIVMPEGTERMINTLDLNNRLGKPGESHSWPITVDKNGAEYDLSRFEPDCGVCEKYFFHSPLPTGEACLQRAAPGQSLRLRFPTREVPYLGIWMNQGGLLGQNNVALEPATGSLDDLYISRKWDRTLMIPPNESHRFWLELELF